MTHVRTALLATVAPVAFASAPPVMIPTNGPREQYRVPETNSGAAHAADSVARASYTGDEMLKRSPDIASMLDYWDLTDTLVDGHGAMRRAGGKYLPKFDEETDPEYHFRLDCTKYTNVYRDIVETLASKPFQEEVTLVKDENNATPSEIEEFIENVDGAGNNITIFSNVTFFNGINSAIDWIFVDYSKPDPNIRNMADAKAAGLRPFWSHVLGRNIIKALAQVINGKEVLTYIKIFEPGAPDHVREFVRNPDGSVIWRLYQKTETMIDGKTQFVEIDSGNITIGIIPLVPFYTGRRDGRTFRFFPMMRDAADLQVELYQDESALKFAKRMTAYPMLSGNGIRPEKSADGQPKKLKTGPSRVLYAPADNAGNVGSWSYVEPSAASLKFLADDIKETINQLRELGRQPLTAQSGNLTVITAAAAASKARSAVGAWALGLKDALENAMVITCMWFAIADTEYSPQVNVYTEFDEFTEGKDLEDLQAMRTNHDLSQETLWEEKKRRGVLSPEFDPETERQRLLDEMPGIGEDTANINDPPPAPGDLTAPPVVVGSTGRIDA